MDNATGSTVGNYAPDFELKDINGKKVALSEFKGKVIVLAFWATYCSPCREEMISLNNLYISLKDKGFIVLAISLDASERRVRSFISEKRITLPVFMDLDKKASRDKYAVRGLPTSFLIDKKGVIVEILKGETEWDSPDMKNKILRLLN